MPAITSSASCSDKINCMRGIANIINGAQWGIRLLQELISPVYTQGYLPSRYLDCPHSAETGQHARGQGWLFWGKT